MTRGIATHVWHAPPVRNTDPEVGNASILFGNWGTRGTTKHNFMRRLSHDRQVTKGSTNSATVAARRKQFDNQVTRGPCHVVVLAETTEDCQTLLGTPHAVAEPDHETDLQSRVQQRPMHQHCVVRSSEEKCALPDGHPHGCRDWE